MRRGMGICGKRYGVHVCLAVCLSVSHARPVLAYKQTSSGGHAPDTHSCYMFSAAPPTSAREPADFFGAQRVHSKQRFPTRYCVHAV